ncbi:MAG TPA: hypothetical protein VF040_16240 [Ktedonobacterales bacterium]
MAQRPAAAPLPNTPGHSQRLPRQNPRVVAALCYAIPCVASVVVLLRERRNRFVRFHAAQALIFFATILLTQLILFTALVILGNIVQANTWLVALGVLFIGGFLALGVGALILWLWMLADCWAGQATQLPLISRLALRLEQMLTEVRREVANSRTKRENPMA